MRCWLFRKALDIIDTSEIGIVLSSTEKFFDFSYSGGGLVLNRLLLCLGGDYDLNILLFIALVVLDFLWLG